MNCVFYWIFGVLIALNVGNFLFACFKKKVMSIGSQRGWFFFLLLKLLVDAILILGYFVSINPFSRFELFFWLSLGVLSEILSWYSVKIFRRKFVEKLMAGVYSFQVTHKTYRPRRVFGELETDFCKEPLSAELNVRTYEDYQRRGVFLVKVQCCYYSLENFLGDGDVIIVVPQE